MGRRSLCRALRAIHRTVSPPSPPPPWERRETRTPTQCPHWHLWPSRGWVPWKPLLGVERESNNPGLPHWAHCPLSWPPSVGPYHCSPLPGLGSRLPTRLEAPTSPLPPLAPLLPPGEPPPILLSLHTPHETQGSPGVRPGSSFPSYPEPCECRRRRAERPGRLVGHSTTVSVLWLGQFYAQSVPTAVSCWPREGRPDSGTGLGALE